MNRPDPVWFVAGWGASAAVLLALGAGTIGGIMALAHVGLLVGGPLALLLADTLRARSAVVVLAAALSLAITAMAVQSLVWFDLARAEAIIALATVYGVALALLLSSSGATPSAATPIRPLRPTGRAAGQPSSEGSQGRW